MPRNYRSLYTTTLYGDRLSLQLASTVITGGSRGTREYLVGPDDLRKALSTAETTGTNLAADGISFLTSSVSSGVYTLDPPVPGVRKMIVGTTGGTGTWYVKTANSENIMTSMGSSFTVINCTGGSNGILELVGLTTAMWGSPDLATGTSSQNSAFRLSTTT